MPVSALRRTLQVLVVDLSGRSHHSSRPGVPWAFRVDDGRFEPFHRCKWSLNIRPQNK